ncbi:MAG: calcium-translocating P-type ATPase, PMCA-type [Bacteroidales bacterium]|nr:calcium-translocating P-type ATPase, PMCA-type [Bacteroidales bacterium]
MNFDFRNLCLDNDSDIVKQGKGKNIIEEKENESLWQRFLEKFKDPLIVVLLIVFVFSLGVSLYEVLFDSKSLATLIEPLGILVALLLATGVGFIFEVKAENEFKILNKKKDERLVKVLRREGTSSKNPKVLQIKKSDVVKRDIVKLESGDEVPADGILLKTNSFMVDESAFTGEMYATKTSEKSNISNQGTYPENFLLRSSIVIEGNAIYQVTAVGMDTEEGKGARIIQENEDVETPLNKQLKDLGNGITKASYIIATLIILGRFIYYFWFDGNTLNNTSPLEILSFALNSVMIAVTLIVVAVPEGLPMSVTISLALSMRKMLKENNLVRKLHACETMGATTVICTDKTGTLTENKLCVNDNSIEFYTNIDFILQNIAINSTAELSLDENQNLKGVGNPTEVALLKWLKEEKDLDYTELRNSFEILEQKPFSAETKYMITLCRNIQTKKECRFIKGAPEIVLKMCDVVAQNKNANEVLQHLNLLQKEGLRTLAFAMQEIDKAKPTSIVFCGFLGMSDTVRENVKSSIDVCHNAGVNIIMVTGDVELTANQIALQTGIAEDEKTYESLSAEKFESMTDEQIREVLPYLKVLSRAKPEDKARLVGLLQETNQIVAVTGDGTTDAPALKKAHVGLSMGDGTSRAKEVSDITIIDNSFASITKAILWGRSLYMNIKRFILFQMTINVCACLIVLIGAFTGLDSPLNVTQMLWVNLIMDTFAAIALASLPADSRVMKDKPRNPNSKIIDSKMGKRILIMGGFFFVFLFGLWQLLWHCDITEVRNLLEPSVWHKYFRNFFDFSKSKPHLNSYELGIFFTFFVMLQLWNLFNARYFRTGRSLLRDIISSVKDGENITKNNSIGFISIVFVIFFGQVFIVNVLGEMFGVSPLSFMDWLWILILTCPILLIGDAIRIIRKWFNRL